jgi:hypothetical protein
MTFVGLELPQPCDAPLNLSDVLHDCTFVMVYWS